MPSASPAPLTGRLALTLGEAADVAAVSVSTIRRAISAGTLKAARLGTRAGLRVRPIDLDDYLRHAAGSDERAIVAATIDVGTE